VEGEMEGNVMGEDFPKAESLEGIDGGDKILPDKATSEELPDKIECCCESCIRAYFGRRKPNDLCRIEDWAMDHIEEVADLYVSWPTILISSLHTY
jgi:hypothetical protein